MKTKKKEVLIRIDSQTRAKLKMLALKEGVTMKDYVAGVASAEFNKKVAKFS